MCASTICNESQQLRSMYICKVKTALPHNQKIDFVVRKYRKLKFQ